MNNVCKNPRIVIDFPRNRIRIHKRTLRLLGTPEYVMLIINPKQNTLCVVNCESSIQGAHKIALNKSYSFELCSKSLNGTLQEVFPLFQGNKSYSIEGELIAVERMVKFDITKSIPLNSTGGKNEQ